MNTILKTFRNVIKGKETKDTEGKVFQPRIKRVVAGVTEDAPFERLEEMIDLFIEHIDNTYKLNSLDEIERELNILLRSLTGMYKITYEHDVKKWRGISYNRALQSIAMSCVSLEEILLSEPDLKNGDDAKIFYALVSLCVLEDIEYTEYVKYYSLARTVTGLAEYMLTLPEYTNIAKYMEAWDNIHLWIHENVNKISASSIENWDTLVEKGRIHDDLSEEEVLDYLESPIKYAYKRLGKVGEDCS